MAKTEIFCNISDGSVGNNGGPGLRAGDSGAGIEAPGPGPAILRMPISCIIKKFDNINNNNIILLILIIFVIWLILLLSAI